MADFYFACRVRVDINKYPSGAALLDRWLEEAEAAEAFEKEGIIPSIWKDVSEPAVYPVLKIEADSALEAHAAVLEAFKSVPMGGDGAILLDRVAQVRPYAEWREFLRERKK